MGWDTTPQPWGSRERLRRRERGPHGPSLWAHRSPRFGRVEELPRTASSAHSAPAEDNKSLSYRPPSVSRTPCVPPDPSSAMPMIGGETVPSFCSSPPPSWPWSDSILPMPATTLQGYELSHRVKHAATEQYLPTEGAGMPTR